MEAAKLVVKVIERVDGRCVVYISRHGQRKRRQRCESLGAALEHIAEEVGYCKSSLGGIGSASSAKAASRCDKNLTKLSAPASGMTILDVITKWSTLFVSGLNRCVAKLMCTFEPSKETSLRPEQKTGATEGASSVGNDCGEGGAFNSFLSSNMQNPLCGGHQNSNLLAHTHISFNNPQPVPLFQCYGTPTGGIWITHDGGKTWDHQPPT
jgi:hypothetical protein